MEHKTVVGRRNFIIMFSLGFGWVILQLCLHEQRYMNLYAWYIATSFHQKTIFMENTFESVNELNEASSMPETTTEEQTNSEVTAAFEEEQNEEGTEENPDEIDAEDLSGEIEEDNSATEEQTEE